MEFVKSELPCEGKALKRIVLMWSLLWTTSSEYKVRKMQDRKEKAKQEKESLIAK